jgi:hypothetical protein
LARFFSYLVICGVKGVLYMIAENRRATHTIWAKLNVDGYKKNIKKDDVTDYLYISIAELDMDLQI